jgi:cysteine desulfurase
VTPLYFDYNATAPLRPAALQAMTAALQCTGNASSVHRPGRQARQRLEAARDIVAAHVGVGAAGVIFTSGGTEANILALRGWSERRCLVSGVEHPSVSQAGPSTPIPVDGDGIVDLAALAALLTADRRPALVAVMLANNETGVCQPIAEVVRLAHAAGALVHADAVQALGKQSIDQQALGVDSLALSAHKIGGPPGVGALVLKDPDRAPAPQLTGGGQERRLRSGTENTAGIVGFAAAIADLGDIKAEAARLAGLRDALEAGCRAVTPAMQLVGAAVPRLPNTSCLALPGVAAQTLLMALDLESVAVSAGSACSSGKLGPSPVLLAMGRPDLAQAAIRVSLGWATTPADIDQFLARWQTVARRVLAEHRAA